MNDTIIRWLVEDTLWCKYAVETQLLDLKSDASTVIRDKCLVDYQDSDIRSNIR